MIQAELDSFLDIHDQSLMVDGKMLPGPCTMNSKGTLREMIAKHGDQETEKILLLSQHPTFLDICLGNLDLQTDATSFRINLPVATEIVVATPNGPDGLEMMICPPSGSRDKMEPGIYSIPTFEVEYHIGGVDSDVNFELLCDSMDLIRLQFETELLLDLLSKSVRSQRNKIDSPLSQESISEAMELIERESRRVTNSILNTKAFAIWRGHINSNGGTLFGTNALCCSPRKRQNLKRNYFLGPSHMLGVIAMTIPNVSIDVPDVTMTMRMGAVILDRSLISSINGPQ